MPLTSVWFISNFTTIHMKHPIELLVVGLALGGALMAADEKTEMGVVTGDRVNVRARALGTAEICCQLKKDDAVEILERQQIPTIGTNTEEWVRIKLPEQATVWLEAALIDEKGVTKKRVNGRAGPGLRWPVLGVLPKGEMVVVRTNDTDWAGITPPRATSAWVSGHYIRGEEANIPTAPVAKPR